MKRKLLFFAIASAILLAAASHASEPVVFADFEDGEWGDWIADGAAFGAAPTLGSEDPRTMAPNDRKLEGWSGEAFASSWNLKTGVDFATGRLTSPSFKIEKPSIAFLIAGGKYEGLQCINLVVDDKVVRSTTGVNSDRMVEESWDVADLMGKTAYIVIVDAEIEGGVWAHIGVDRIEFRDK